MKSVQYRMKIRAKQKEEQGEMLQDIDLEQLQIESHQLLEIIDEKNVALLKYKKKTGEINQDLTRLKVINYFLKNCL